MIYKVNFYTVNLSHDKNVNNLNNIKHNLTNMNK